MANYTDLKNRDGTIYLGDRAFSSPAELAQYLGIQPHQIDWGQIPRDTADYSNLINKNGTIYNTQTGRAYANPLELAADLGIQPHQIDWGQIRDENAAQQIDTGNEALNQLLQQTQQYLDRLIQRGQTINPEIDITEEQAAEFLSQAQKEISPYYDTQMKIAREGLLRTAGYTTDEIASREAELERNYGRRLETIGETAAETGFALSGKRKLEEKELAEETQRIIDENRRKAEYGIGGLARQFAGEWGGEALPEYSYKAAPTVVTGERKFNKTLDMKPFYNISDSIYEKLKGSRQYEQQTAERQRASELEKAWRMTEENRLRKLNL